MNNDANSEISAIKNQMFVLLLALIVISGTLTAYLFQQSRVLGYELETNQRLVKNFNQSQPAIATLINQLGAYGMNHPEIRPVLAKYGIQPVSTQPGLTSPTAITPTAPSAAPKK